MRVSGGGLQKIPVKTGDFVGLVERQNAYLSRVQRSHGEPQILQVLVDLAVLAVFAYAGYRGSGSILYALVTALVNVVRPPIFFGVPVPPLCCVILTRSPPRAYDGVHLARSGPPSTPYHVEHNLSGVEHRRLAWVLGYLVAVTVSAGVWVVSLTR